MPTEAVAPIEHTAPTAQSARGDPAGVRERLRALIRSIEQRPARPPPPPPRDACAGPPLDAQPRATALGECLYREVRYDLDFAFGHEPLGGVLHAAGPLLALLAPAEDVERAAAADLLFLDIETSGLGGAGATTFLVAAARLEAAPAPALVLRQYLAPSPAAEAALLSALVEDARLAGEPVLVTYNGRSFDAPVLDGRLTMHRQRGAFEALRHVDLLHPSRLIYRALPSRRLATIEAEVLGFTRPSGDVSGAEIPGWYFRYLRSGDPRAVAPLMRHNELDVLALVALLGRLAGALAGAWTPKGVEALGFARLLARRGAGAAARAQLEAALGALAPSIWRDEALFRLAALHKRDGRHDLAEPLWLEAARRPRGSPLPPVIELAKHHEHRTKDLARALDFADRALAIAARVTRPGSPGDRALDALLHRRARIARKIEAGARAADAG